MKILVLGDSDTSGSSPERPSWTRVAADRVMLEGREPVELVETTLLPAGDRAPRVARKRVEEHEPEIVILPVGAWVFASGFVWLRVRRLFGERAGRWFRGMEMGIENATQKGGRVRKRINRVLKWTARRVIGTEPFTTREEATRAIDATLQALSQVEDIQVLVVAYAAVGDALRKPAVIAERQRFVDDVRAGAAKRHFTWVDCSEAFAEAARSVRTTKDDGLHVSQAGNQILGGLVAEALLQRNT